LAHHLYAHEPLVEKWNVGPVFKKLQLEQIDSRLTSPISFRKLSFYPLIRTSIHSRGLPAGLRSNAANFNSAD
jgi:hypothetical protein